MTEHRTAVQGPTYRPKSAYLAIARRFAAIPASYLLYTCSQAICVAQRNKSTWNDSPFLKDFCIFHYVPSATSITDKVDWILSRYYGKYYKHNYY